MNKIKEALWMQKFKEAKDDKELADVIQELYSSSFEFGRNIGRKEGVHVEVKNEVHHTTNNDGWGPGERMSDLWDAQSMQGIY